MRCCSCLFTSQTMPPVSPARIALYEQFIRSNTHWQFDEEEKAVIGDVFTHPAIPTHNTGQTAAKALEMLLTQYEQSVTEEQDTQTLSPQELNNSDKHQTSLFLLVDIYNQAIDLLNARLQHLYATSQDSALNRKGDQHSSKVTTYHCKFPQHPNFVLQRRYCRYRDGAQYGVVRNQAAEENQQDQNKKPYAVIAKKNALDQWELQPIATWTPPSPVTPPPHAPDQIQVEEQAQAGL